MHVLTHWTHQIIFLAIVIKLITSKAAPLALLLFIKVVIFYKGLYILYF